MDTSTQTPTATPTTDDRIVRPRRGRIVAGVAAGIAEKTGIDVGIVRVLFAISLVFGGAGLVVYAAAWAFLPSEGEPRSPMERWFGSDK